MSNDELEQMLDENQRMKNQRKWVLVTLGLAVGLVAWGMMRGHDAPKADAETAETDKPKLAASARRLPSPLVAPRQEPATPEPQQQPVAPEQDQVAADPPLGDNTPAGNDAAAASTGHGAASGNCACPNSPASKVAILRRKPFRRRRQQASGLPLLRPPLLRSISGLWRAPCAIPGRLSSCARTISVCATPGGFRSFAGGRASVIYGRFGEMARRATELSGKKSSAGGVRITGRIRFPFLTLCRRWQQRKRG